MTDPKPATPATDQEIAAWQHDCYTRSACDRGQFGPCLEQNLFARIAADAEKLRAAEQHHRDMLTAVGEEATRQLAAKDEEIERLKAQVQVGHDVIRDFDSRIDTARAHVETLRAAAEMALDLTLKYARPGDDEGYVFSNRVTTKLRAALAATEPKG